MRNFILTPPLLVLLAVISGLILLAEWGIASTRDGERVIATASHCTGKALAAEYGALSLALSCDSGHPAHTSAPVTIKRYAEAPTTRFVCDIHKSESADCKAVP